MAVKVVRVEVCDVCGSEEGLGHFRLTERGGTSRAVAVCGKDGADLLRGLLQTVTAPPKRKARGVVSMAEVQKAKKAPARRTRAAKTG